MDVRPPKNPTEINRRFLGVDGQTIGLETEPWYPPIDPKPLEGPMSEKAPITDTPAPTSARAGVTGRIAEASAAPVTTGLTGAPENRGLTGAPSTPEGGAAGAPETRGAKGGKPAKDDE